MTHELKYIVEQALWAKQNNIKSVLASVVALDGSSYRRPGVRMLVLEGGRMVGAVSGGCVEKEILLQSETVFKTGVSKIMTYDGRYRLGCEGILYILLEQFEPTEAFSSAFFSCLKERKPLEVWSYFNKKEGSVLGIGSVVKIEEKTFSISALGIGIDTTKQSVFKQKLPPCFKMVIVGAEHDAVQLCKYAALTGWEVTVIAGASESKSITDFPGAHAFYAQTPEQLGTQVIDEQTAVVLMSHNFANDLRYLVALKACKPAYIGLLGPARRREDMLSQFLEYCPDADEAFLDSIYGPAGINIGAETPQEIAVSIISEILAVTRQQEPIPLSQKTGCIHS
ncbi:XdhC family protein [Snuella sedimenti]|uniref:XdhC family protein n=1 Tax=Snuella sedimenti TaxID=2798802 RepID=A0A8J7ISR1_9FLAO|nr:XdhC/CoxI family protein [Snuella sedimenti]MBJ6367235.1 XdhC family protein [Snuella sedimenti]